MKLVLNFLKDKINKLLHKEQKHIKADMKNETIQITLQTCQRSQENINNTTMKYKLEDIKKFPD